MKTFRDLATGAAVTQVTDGPAICHPTYFLQSSFFPGGREMFYTSYATGAAQLCEVSLDSGETRQLTTGAPIHPYSAALHPSGGTLVVTRGGGLWAGERCIVDWPGRGTGRMFHQPRRRVADCRI
jgi:Tol biopolymer transport system component